MAVVLGRAKKPMARLAEHAMTELRKLVQFAAELVEQPGYRAEMFVRLMVLPPIAVSLHSSACAWQAIHRGRTTHRQLQLNPLGALLRLLAGWAAAH